VFQALLRLQEEACKNGKNNGFKYKVLSCGAAEYVPVISPGLVKEEWFSDPACLPFVLLSALVKHRRTPISLSKPVETLWIQIQGLSDQKIPALGGGVGPVPCFEFESTPQDSVQLNKYDE